MQEFSEYSTSERIDFSISIQKRDIYFTPSHCTIDVYLILIGGLVVSENVDFWIPQKKIAGLSYFWDG